MVSAFPCAETIFLTVTGPIGGAAWVRLHQLQRLATLLVTCTIVVGSPLCKYAVDFVDDALLAAAARLPALTQLHLRQCGGLSADGLAAVCANARLQALSITGGSDMGPVALYPVGSDLTGLTRLNLMSNTNVCGGLGYLTTLRELQALDLFGCDLTDEGLGHVAELGALTGGTRWNVGLRLFAVWLQRTSGIVALHVRESIELEWI